MNFLRFCRRPHLAIVFASLIFLISCSSDSTFPEQNEAVMVNFKNAEQDLTEREIRGIFQKYSNSFAAVAPNFGKVVEKLNAGATSEDLRNDADMAKVIDHMKQPSIELFEELRFTDEQYMEMYGTTSVEEVSEQLTGTALILFTMQPEYQDHGYDPPKAVACFLEATGIAAGIAIIGGLTGSMGGAALTAAFTRVVAKVGIRTLSGIGLGLMAAEFVWCMVR